MRSPWSSNSTSNLSVCLQQTLAIKYKCKMLALKSNRLKHFV